MNRPETHEILREWRSLADGYAPRRVLMGEAYVLDIPAWAGYYGSGTDELNLAFNFALVHADLDAASMRSVVAEVEDALPAGAWPCWCGSNHDAGRLATRWCGGDEALARCALLMLLTLRGTPVLYYGDELGLTDGHVPPERVLDVAEPSRDPCRTPMPWSRQGGWEDPWLPLEDTSRNVEDQRDDHRTSTLTFTRDLIALRKRLRTSVRLLPATPRAGERLGLESRRRHCRRAEPRHRIRDDRRHRGKRGARDEPKPGRRGDLGRLATRYGRGCGRQRGPSLATLVGWWSWNSPS